MKKTICLSVLIILIFSSCKKKIYGCTDPAAENYSSVATEDMDNCVYSEAGSYQSYVSTISQSGTDNPTSNVLDNSLNISISWARQSEGKYIGTLDQSLDLNKATLFYSTPSTHLAVQGGFLNSSSVKLWLDNGLGNWSDNFSNLSFEIRLYD